MKRIVLGVDEEGRHEAALRLLARLRFADAVIDAVSVVEPPLWFALENRLPLPLASAEKAVNTLSDEERFAQDECEATLQELRSQGCTPGAAAVVFGHAASELMDYASRSRACLIAAGGARQGIVPPLITGSVARSLVLGAPLSVLIAKGHPEERGQVRAVLATDHSRYAAACLPVLLALAPKGISHLTVLTAYSETAIQRIGRLLPECTENPAACLEEVLIRHNADALSALAPLGCPLDSRVVRGSTHEAIRAVMQETASDLLILGAQGHSFLKRITLGGISLHQAVAEPHSVLVLRIPSSHGHASEDHSHAQSHVRDDA